jgi:hypothetical protein
VLVLGGGNTQIACPKARVTMAPFSGTVCARPDSKHRPHHLSSYFAAGNATPACLHRRLLTYGAPCLLLEVDGTCPVVEDVVCRFEDDITFPLTCADGAE